MPVAKPAVPTCTPADRSKWPPIINSDMGIAIRPTVEAPGQADPRDPFVRLRLGGRAFEGGGHRVPAAASLRTAAALALVIRLGPVRTGSPPPSTFKFAL